MDPVDPDPDSDPDPQHWQKVHASLRGATVLSLHHSILQALY
jgi:hypothetical protein